jgi:tRNA G18 (ribose-2'-O)-methylase SpoU
MRRRIALDRKHTVKRFQRHKRKNQLATPGVHSYIIVLDNLKPNFNIGKIFRSAEAFGAHEVHLIGTDFFDPSPAMGAFKWVPARFHETFDTCYRDLTKRGYRIYAMEPGGDASLADTRLPERSAFIFGHEEFGISFDKNDYTEVRDLQIPQYGKSQSLNVSVAASIVMYEYVRQNGQGIA